MSETQGPPPRKESGADPAFRVVDRRPAAAAETDIENGPRYPTVVEELRARAEDAEKRAREISAAYRSIEEERQAFRDRLTRDMERRVEVARAATLRQVLGVLDDLDRAAARTDATPEALFSGVLLIRDRLRQILASEGVRPLALAGQPFDPAVAEAVSVEDVDDPARHDIVIEECDRGYALGGSLLRPARVRVARHRGAPSASGPAADQPGPTADPPAPGRRSRRGE